MSKFNIGLAYQNFLSEYKKIFWPKKQNIFHTTVIVLLVTAFVAIMVLLFDITFNFVISQLTAILSKIVK